MGKVYSVGRPAVHHSLELQQVVGSIYYCHYVVDASLELAAETQRNIGALTLAG